MGVLDNVDIETDAEVETAPSNRRFTGVYAAHFNVNGHADKIAPHKQNCISRLIQQSTSKTTV